MYNGVNYLLLLGYIFDIQWSINIPTVCSQIISNIYYSYFIPCILLILYAGISIINSVNFDIQVKIISGALVHSLKSKQFLLTDDVFSLIESSNQISNEHHLYCVWFKNSISDGQKLFMHISIHFIFCIYSEIKEFRLYGGYIRVLLYLEIDICCFRKRNKRTC